MPIETQLFCVFLLYILGIGSIWCIVGPYEEPEIPLCIFWPLYLIGYLIITLIRTLKLGYRKIKEEIVN